MDRLTELERDYYCDDLSEGCAATDSSDEDQDEAMRNLEFWRGANLKSTQPTHSKPEEDEFETEMNASLSASFENHKNNWILKKEHDKVSSNLKGLPDKKSFNPLMNNQKCLKQRLSVEIDDTGAECKATDSDEEFFESNQASMKEYGRTNDDLLYDPTSDEVDQKWVDEQRKIYQTSAKLAKSDAILNCPACMTTLCFDCQRHAVYKTQYRAMFVMNCAVVQDEILFMPKSAETNLAKKSKKRSRSTAAMEVESAESSAEKVGDKIKSGQRHYGEDVGKMLADCQQDDLFKPVRCSKCNTEVAVYDSDEVYHFFNVLSSYV